MDKYYYARVSKQDMNYKIFHKHTSQQLLNIKTILLSL